jgi:hypothetical protein
VERYFNNSHRKCLLLLPLDSLKSILKKTIYRTFAFLTDKEDKKAMSGIQIVGLFLANELEPFYNGPEVDIEGITQLDFYRSFVALLGSTSRKIYSSAAEVVQ